MKTLRNTPNEAIKDVRGAALAAAIEEVLKASTGCSNWVVTLRRSQHITEIVIRLFCNVDIPPIAIEIPATSGEIDWFRWLDARIDLAIQEIAIRAVEALTGVRW